MFDSLSTRLQDVFRTLRGQGRLTEDLVEAALREIRLALLEADVNFKVVKAFIDRVRDRAMDQDVLRSLSPSQQVVKIVRDEMVALFGDAEGGLRPTNKHPRVILLLGLQGAGKTTTAGKLAKWLTKLDGDARGGAALSVVSVVGVPIAFVGSGERLEDLEPFHPERVVSRVLGMGDVLSLIEKAEQAITEEDAERLEEKIRSNEFTLEDFRD